MDITNNNYLGWKIIVGVGLHSKTLGTELHCRSKMASESHHFMSCLHKYVRSQANRPRMRARLSAGAIGVRSSNFVW